MARILVLEDDSPMRSVLSVMLESLGHEPVEAGSCDVAMARQRTDPCDLVLVDLESVEAGGLDQLRRAAPETPILLGDGGGAADPEICSVRNLFDLGDLYESVEAALDGLPEPQPD